MFRIALALNLQMATQFVISLVNGSVEPIIASVDKAEETTQKSISKGIEKSTKAHAVEN